MLFRTTSTSTVWKLFSATIHRAWGSSREPPVKRKKNSYFTFKESWRSACCLHSLDRSSCTPFLTFFLIIFFFDKDVNGNRSPREAGCTRQSIQFTGLGTPAFQKAIQAIRDIDHRLSRHFPAGSFIAWKPSSFDEFASIDTGNRYFTPRKHALQSDIIKFSVQIDPNGILSRSCQEQFVHSIDNHVSYFERIWTKEKSKSVKCLWSNWSC